MLTNGGGPRILVAEACEAAGLLVPGLSEDTQAALRFSLPGPGGRRDPVDVVASASAEQYGRSLRPLGAAGEIDAITVVFIVPFLPCAEDVTREIIATVADLPAKPVIAVFMMAGAGSASLSDVGIPRLHLPRAGRRRAGTDRAVGGVAGPARGPRGDTPASTRAAGAN